MQAYCPPAVWTCQGHGPFLLPTLPEAFSKTDSTRSGSNWTLFDEEPKFFQFSLHYSAVFVDHHLRQHFDQHTHLLIESKAITSTLTGATRYLSLNFKLQSINFPFFILLQVSGNSLGQRLLYWFTGAGGHGRSHGRKRSESIGGQDPLERQQPPHHGSFAVVFGVPESPRPVGRKFTHLASNVIACLRDFLVSPSPVLLRLHHQPQTQNPNQIVDDPLVLLARADFERLREVSIDNLPGLKSRHAGG